MGSLSQVCAHTAANAKEETLSWSHYLGISGQVFPVQFSNSSCFNNRDLRFRNKTNVPPWSLVLTQLRIRSPKEREHLSVARSSKITFTGSVHPKYMSPLSTRNRTDQTVSGYFWSKKAQEPAWVPGLLPVDTLSAELSEAVEKSGS